MCLLASLTILQVQGNEENVKFIQNGIMVCNVGAERSVFQTHVFLLNSLISIEVYICTFSYEEAIGPISSYFPFV